ncbi:MAG: DUF3795 domain-containing protein [Endomicrobiales bacterium]|nr:DUF3795 domain-containing protein [Endomicrobiales bacterium]
MKEIISNTGLVAYCGLYCGACGAYLKDKCPGCHDNSKATWCKIRLCCIDNHYKSCADCREFPVVKDCKKFNNFISKIFGLVFRSDRAACIKQIRDIGISGHADNMTQQKRHSIKRQ